MELIDAALYLNHYWLMTLLGALLFVLPVGRAWSVDAYIGRVEPSRVVPAWMVWMARAQVGIVYVVAGVATCGTTRTTASAPQRHPGG